MELRGTAMSEPGLFRALGSTQSASGVEKAFDILNYNGSTFDNMLRIFDDQTMELFGNVIVSADNTHSIGSTSVRVKEVHAFDVYTHDGGVHTSDERLKHVYRDGGGNPVDEDGESIEINPEMAMKIIDAVQWIMYRWKDHSSEEKVTTKKETRQKTKTVVTERVVPVLDKITGKWVEGVEKHESEEPVFIEHILHDKDGNPIIDEEFPGQKIEYRMHKEPVMETIEVTESVPAQDYIYKRTHMGVSAQQFRDALLSLGYDPNEFAAYIHDKESDTYGARYIELIPLLASAIKAINTHNQQLADRVANLEGRTRGI